MAYKNALAGLDHGGGKAVIIGDPKTLKSEALLRAYGRFVASLGGRYFTACDVGTFPADMDMVARECPFTTGRSVEHGGAGDSAILTAFGVYQGMRASAEHVWGSPSLAGRRVGVAGVGKVGRYLVGHLAAEGAEIVVTDVSEAALAAITAAHPGVRTVPDTATLIREELDVYAPCALGNALDDDTVPVLTARVVCGGANNQLAHQGIEKTLQDRGHPLRARLPRERRRSHPGGGRDRRLLVRAGEGPGVDDLRHDQARLRHRGRRRHPARSRRRSPRGAADGRRRAPAGDPPAGRFGAIASPRTVLAPEEVP